MRDTENGTAHGHVQKGKTQMDRASTNNMSRETPQDGSAPLGPSDSNSGGHEPGKPRKFGPHDPERANHLKKYRWRKGIASPNTAGRPRALLRNLEIFHNAHPMDVGHLTADPTGCRQNYQCDDLQSHDSSPTTGLECGVV